MNNKRTYIVSVKLILIILVVISILGAVAGAISARYVTDVFLRKNPQGNRVIETIQTQAQTASFVGIVNGEKGNVVGILNDKKQVTRLGTVLTADGIFVMPEIAGQNNSVSVMLADGSIAVASLARSYPEKGVSFYRVGGAFTAPQFSTGGAIEPGQEGVMIGMVSNDSRITVIPGMIRRYSLAENLDDVVFRERQVIMSVEPDGEFLGAPLFNLNNNLLGIVVNTGKGIILPGAEIEMMLRDYLKHGSGLEVVLFDGLKGLWTRQLGTDGKTDVGFKITSVVDNSVFDKAGLRQNDVIYSVNEKDFSAVRLWEIFLESARAGKPALLGIARGNESLVIPVTVIIQNETRKNKKI